MADLPDRNEHQRRFMALDNAERRTIIRAVNRGQAVEVRKHAPLAVGVARRQQRFWRWAWVFGPIMVAVNVALVPLEVALLNGALVTLALGAASTFWFRRAKRAEALNLAIVGGKRPPRATTGERAADARAATTTSGPLGGLRARFTRSGRAGADGSATTTGAGGESRARHAGHLPGERRGGTRSASVDGRGGDDRTTVAGSATDDPGTDDTEPTGEVAPTVPGTRPYRPRGRKRR